MSHVNNFDTARPVLEQVACGAERPVRRRGSVIADHEAQVSCGRRASTHWPDDTPELVCAGSRRRLIMTTGEQLHSATGIASNPGRDTARCADAGSGEPAAGTAAA